jgi:hypothetical protein
MLIATAGVVGIDGATGGWLHTTTMLGYSPPSGGRFYGMPNTSLALPPAATVLAAGTRDRAPRTRRAAGRRRRRRVRGRGPAELLPGSAATSAAC